MRLLTLALVMSPALAQMSGVSLVGVSVGGGGIAAQTVSYESSDNCGALGTAACLNGAGFAGVAPNISVHAGDFLVCIASVVASVTPNTVTCPDSVGNTYVEIAGSPFIDYHVGVPPFYGATVHVWAGAASTTTTLSFTPTQTVTTQYITAVVANYRGSIRTPTIDQIASYLLNNDHSTNVTGYTGTTVSPTEMLVSIFGGNPNVTYLVGNFYSAGNVLLGQGNLRQSVVDGSAAGTATMLQDYSVTSIGSYQANCPTVDAYGPGIIFTLY